MDSILQGVQQVVQSLYDQHGRVESKALVDAARPETSPAHDAFEWDDAAAAEQHRLQQARRWIRIVKIEVGGSIQPLYHVPSRIASAPGHYDVPTNLAKVPDEYERAESVFKSRLRSDQNALQELRRAAAVFGRDKPELDDVETHLNEALALLEAE